MQQHTLPTALVLAVGHYYFRPLPDDLDARAKALFCAPSDVITHRLTIPTGIGPTAAEPAHVVLHWGPNAKGAYPVNPNASKLLRAFGAVDEQHAPTKTIHGVALVTGARPGGEQAHDLTDEARMRILTLLIRPST